MPRIPSAIAVVAMLALCIGFNVAYYPAVRRMTPACGLSLPGLGSKEAGPAASIPGSGGPHPGSGGAESASPAFCTAGGICFDASGKRLPGKAETTREAPAQTNPVARDAVPAADNPAAPGKALAGNPDAAAPPPNTATELPLIPAIRRPLPQGTASAEGGAELASAGRPAAPTPLDRQALAAKRIERLPAVEGITAAGAEGYEPAIPPGSIPIYPTTPVR